MATIDQKVALLEEQQALTVDLLARVLKGNWHEGAGSAEALLRAISPKYSQFDAVMFPGITAPVEDAPVPPPPSTSIQVYRDRGHPSGVIRQKPRGVLLHGTRSESSTNTIRQEFDGTRAYAKNSYIPSGDYYTGWHATVGEDAYSVHMTPREFGWNVGDESDEWFALELAQTVVSKPITDAQIRAAAACVKAELLPVWGTFNWDDPAVLQCHSERPQGQTAGKTDTFPRGDPRVAELKARLRAALKAA